MNADTILNYFEEIEEELKVKQPTPTRRNLKPLNLKLVEDANGNLTYIEREAEQISI